VFEGTEGTEGSNKNGGVRKSDCDSDSENSQSHGQSASSPGSVNTPPLGMGVMNSQGAGGIQLHAGMGTQSPLGHGHQHGGHEHHQHSGGIIPSAHMDMKPIV
jgi:hypothetical protein